MCVCVLRESFLLSQPIERKLFPALLHVYTNPPESELSAKREKQPQVSWDTGGSALSKLGEGTYRWSLGSRTENALCVSTTVVSITNAQGRHM